MDGRRLGEGKGLSTQGLHIAVPVQATSKSQMGQGSLDLWVGERDMGMGIHGENSARSAPSTPWVKLNSTVTLLITCLRALYCLPRFRLASK